MSDRSARRSAATSSTPAIRVTGAREGPSRCPRPRSWSARSELIGVEAISIPVQPEHRIQLGQWEEQELLDRRRTRSRRRRSRWRPACHGGWRGGRPAPTRRRGTGRGRRRAVRRWRRRRGALAVGAVGEHTITACRRVRSGRRRRLLPRSPIALGADAEHRMVADDACREETLTLSRSSAAPRRRAAVPTRPARSGEAPCGGAAHVRVRRTDDDDHRCCRTNRR